MIIEKSILILEPDKSKALLRAEQLRSMPGVDRVWYKLSFDKPITEILLGKIDIVLCCMPLTRADVLKFVDIRSYTKPFLLAMVINDTSEKEMDYAPLQIDAFIHYNRIYEELSELIQSGKFADTNDAA